MAPMLRNPSNHLLPWLLSMLFACGSSTAGSPGATADGDSGTAVSGEAGPGGSSGASSSGSAPPDASSGASSSSGGSPATSSGSSGSVGPDSGSSSGSSPGVLGDAGTGCPALKGADAAYPRWPMPNPASAKLPNPFSYDDRGDGTVLDKVTGLVWQ